MVYFHSAHPALRGHHYLPNIASRWPLRGYILLPVWNVQFDFQFVGVEFNQASISRPWLEGQRNTSMYFKNDSTTSDTRASKGEGLEHKVQFHQRKQNGMEFSIRNPLRFRGSAWAINKSSPRWFAPNDCFSRGSCLSTKERGDQWKITSPALTHAHTCTCTHTHTHGGVQLRDQRAATYLSRSLLMWQLAFLMGEGAGGMVALSGRVGPQTTQPVTFSDVCCTFPRMLMMSGGS